MFIVNTRIYRKSETHDKDDLLVTFQTLRNTELHAQLLAYAMDPNFISVNPNEVITQINHISTTLVDNTYNQTIGLMGFLTMAAMAVGESKMVSNLTVAINHQDYPDDNQCYQILVTDDDIKFYAPNNHLTTSETNDFKRYVVHMYNKHIQP